LVACVETEATSALRRQATAALRRQATAADLGRGVEEGEQPRQFFGACIEAAANPGEGGESLSCSCDYWLPASRPRRRKRAAGPPLRFSAASVETAAVSTLNPNIMSEIGASDDFGRFRASRVY